MARFYGTKIKNGEMQLDDVPEFWREETKEWLDKNS